MTLVEVRNLLKETVFSTDNIAPALKIVEKNYLSYKRRYLWWSETHSNEQFLIFNPLPYVGKYPAKLRAIPYWSKYDNNLHTLLFSSVRNGKGWLIAALIEGEIEFYTMHSIDRYEQRVDYNLYMTRHIENVGKLLINNNMSWVRCDNVLYPRKTYAVVRDGMFLCKYENGVCLKTTFISKDLFGPEQKDFYNRQLPELNKHLVENGSPIIEMAA